MERTNEKFVLELLAEYKRSASRWFIISILLLIILFSTIALYEFKESCYEYITIEQEGDLNNINSGTQGNITNKDLDKDLEEDISDLEESGGVLDGASSS